MSYVTLMLAGLPMYEKPWGWTNRKSSFVL